MSQCVGGIAEDFWFGSVCSISATWLIIARTGSFWLLILSGCLWQDLRETVRSGCDGESSNVVTNLSVYKPDGIMQLDLLSI